MGGYQLPCKKSEKKPTIKIAVEDMCLHIPKGEIFGNSFPLSSLSLSLSAPLPHSPSSLYHSLPSNHANLITGMLGPNGADKVRIILNFIYEIKFTKHIF